MATETKNNSKSILDQTVKAGGIVKVTIGDLRNELGFARLGKMVLAQMDEHLTENGLGHFPGSVLNPLENPTPRQWQEVWVYVRDGSAKSAVLDAFANPDANDLVTALNMFSEGAPDFANMDDTQRLAYVRAAVCNG